MQRTLIGLCKTFFVHACHVEINLVASIVNVTAVQSFVISAH